MGRQRLSGSTLKWIAVAAMLADHVGTIVLEDGIARNAPYQLFSDAQFAVLLGVIRVCHMIGRIAFPLFCFFLVEGFLHTHSVKRYLLNLAVFAIVSEPIYDLAFAGSPVSFLQQNVLFTLLLGLLMLLLFRQCGNRLLCVFPIAGLTGLVSFVLRLDGWYYGVALIAVFYLLHDSEWKRCLCALAIMFLCGMNYSLEGIIDPNFFAAAGSLVLIALYNGKRGGRGKYFFYLFYPGHLLALHALAACWIIPWMWSFYS